MLLLVGLYVEVASHGRYFPHYYQLLLPVICMLPALFFYDVIELADTLKNKYTKPILSMLVLIPLFLLSQQQMVYLKMTPYEISEKKYGKLFTESYEVARAVKEMTEPYHKIYEWGAETGIYYYSKRSSVTGIVYIYPLLLGPKEERLKKAQKIYDDVLTLRPELFIFNERFGKIEKNLFFNFIQQHYNFEKRMGSYLIFRTKDDQPC